MEFRIETVYTEADFTAGVAANWIFNRGRRSIGKILSVAGHIAAVPVAVISLFLLIMSVLAGFNPLGLALGMLCALLTRWVWQSGTPGVPSRKLGRAAWNAYDKKGATVRFRFDEDGIQVFEGAGASSYRYHALAGAVESRNRFVLCLSEGAYFFLKKSDFTQGDPTEFRTFLVEKLGKPVESLR